MSSSDASRAGAALPAVDDRLAVPETRFEVLDGALVYVPPADEPHASRQADVAALLRAHAAPGFAIACEMLTRTSKTSDIAPDLSVYPRAPDPATGGRQLEQLAFEVVSTESLGHAAGKAARLVARGVRRVFAIDVQRGRVLEWSTALHSWSVLRDDASIDDPTLGAALPIDALIRTAQTDDAMSRALLIKRNPVLEARSARDLADGERKGRAEGERKGRIDSLLELLTVRGIAVDEAARQRISSEQDPRRIRDWFARAATCATASEMFDDL
jgi:hypothetical protein